MYTYIYIYIYIYIYTHTNGYVCVHTSKSFNKGPEASSIRYSKLAIYTVFVYVDFNPQYKMSNSFNLNWKSSDCHGKSCDFHRNSWNVHGKSFNLNWESWDCHEQKIDLNRTSSDFCGHASDFDRKTLDLNRKAIDVNRTI